MIKIFLEYITYDQDVVGSALSVQMDVGSDLSDQEDTGSVRGVHPATTRLPDESSPPYSSLP